MRVEAAALAALMVTNPVLAQDQTAALRSALQSIVGTISVVHMPGMAEGKLTSCSLNFETLQQDFIYLNGNFIRASGSVGVMAGNDSIGLAVKLVAGELDPAVVPLAPKALQISRVYLMASDTSNNFENLVSTFPAEAEGGLLGVYDLTGSLPVLMEGISTGTLIVAMGLDGKSDVQLAIQMDVASTDDAGVKTRSPHASIAFLECAERLMEGLVP